ncbi:MAG: glycosyltransferase family 39 protein [Myxococcota bacterium]|nr:glycosyltransferase family 39 protein [Myxococcota bacterium]
MQRASSWPAVVLGLIGVAYVLGFLGSPWPLRVHGDGHYTYLWARSLAFDGDLDLSNDYALCGDPWSLREPAREGLGPRNLWSPGPALFWTPALLFARALGVDAGAIDPRVRAACTTGRAVDVAMGTTLLLGWLTVWLVYRFARRHVCTGAALFAAAGVGLCTMLPYYAALLPSYGHAPAAFCVAVALERWDVGRGSRRAVRWALLGALFGLAALMRPQCAVFAVAPALEWLGGAWRTLRREPPRAWLAHVGLGLLFAGTALLCFFPQMWVWKRTYGDWLAVPQGAHYMRWEHPFVDGVLFGSTGGLLTWTPIAYLGVVGLVWAAARRRSRAWAVPTLLGSGLLVWLASVVWDWWGASGFSNRRLTELALPLGAGIALCVDRVLAWGRRHPRRAAAAVGTAVLLAFGGWNWAAMFAVAEGAAPSAREERWPLFWRAIFERGTTGVWNAVGNPLAWPASLPFAIAYRVHPRHWDAMRGQGVHYHEFEPRVVPRAGENAVHPGSGLHALYLVEGFEPRARLVGGRLSAVTSTPRARMLVPLFMADAALLEWRWATVGADRRARARVAVRWNGRHVFTADLDGEPTVHRVAPEPGTLRVGINEIEIDVSGAPVALAEIVLHAPPRAARGP